MITPSFSLTATERVLPKLALDFTTAVLDPRVTFTRTTDATHPATYINSSGVITSATNNQPRFDYDPTTLVCKGLLIEESRTNLLLNTNVLSTQVVVVTAVAYTLSFYGTGNIVLSGSSSATVTGTGTYPSRKTYTFTPSAGALTLTVSGTVQYAQLEVGSWATSYIPTTSAALTRNADVATMTGTNFSDWFNATEGTLQVQADLGYTGTFAAYIYPFAINDNSGNNEITVYGAGGTAAMSPSMVVSGSQQLDYAAGGWTAGTNKVAVGYKQNSTQMGMNASAKTTDTVCNVPTVNQLAIGRRVAGNFWTGHIAKINYWPQRLTSAELAAFTK